MPKKKTTKPITHAGRTRLIGATLIEDVGKAGEIGPMIDAEAASEHRTRNSMIWCLVREALAARKAKSKS